jgi:hypothetical protein
MQTLIAKLRAWLLEIVREAIRLELKRVPFQSQVSSSYIKQSLPPLKFEGVAEYQAPKSEKPTASPPPPEPSFEQLQDESIAEQEKHYAEQRV